MINHYVVESVVDGVREGMYFTGFFVIDVTNMKAKEIYTYLRDSMREWIIENHMPNTIIKEADIRIHPFLLKSEP